MFACLSNGLSWYNLRINNGFMDRYVWLSCRAWAQEFSKYKLVASIAKCIRRLLFAKAEDSESLFAQPHCKTREIAVACNQTKPIEFSCVEQVHSIDDECAVGSIFPCRICKLLNRFDCVPLQHLFPRGTCWGCEVAVYALYGCLTESCNFCKKPLDDCGLCVVSINEDRQTKGRLLGLNFCD